MITNGDLKCSTKVNSCRVALRISTSSIFADESYSSKEEYRIAVVKSGTYPLYSITFSKLMIKLFS